MKFFRTLHALVIPVLLAAALTGIAGCQSRGDENKVSATPTELYASIKEQVELPEMYEGDADWLMNNYGIDTGKLSDYVFLEGDEVHADRLIILKVKDAADMPAIEEKLDNLLGQLSSPEMLSYIPEQAPMIQAASVKKKGDTVYLVISDKAGQIEGIIENGL